MYKVNGKIFDSFINAIKYKNNLLDNNKHQYVTLTRLSDNQIYLYSSNDYNCRWKNAK